MRKSDVEKQDMTSSRSTVYCPCEIAILQEWWDREGTIDQTDILVRILPSAGESVYILN
jgi:hypothetical protein